MTVQHFYTPGVRNYAVSNIVPTAKESFDSLEHVLSGHRCRQVGNAPPSCDEGVQLASFAVEGGPRYHSMVPPDDLGTDAVPGPRGVDEVDIPPDADLVVSLERLKSPQGPECPSLESALGGWALRPQGDQVPERSASGKVAGRLRKAAADVADRPLAPEQALVEGAFQKR